MAILKYGTRFGTIGGKITARQSANLVFQVEGQAFLQWYYPQTDPFSQPEIDKTNGHLYFVSSTPNKAIVNYGDGVIMDYDFYLFNGLYYLAFSSQIGWPPNNAIKNFNPIENHIFTDGETSMRGVTIKISNPNNITAIKSSFVILNNEFPREIANLSVTELSFLFCKKITSFPFQWIRLKTLQSFELRAIAESRIVQYPLSFLEFENINSLSFDTIFDFSDLDSSNARLIGNYGASILSLNVANSNLSDIPIEWSNLTNLKELFVGRNLFTEYPININSIPSLTTVELLNTNFTNWSTINLPNLQTLNLRGPFGASVTGKLSPTFGDSILNSPKLKSIIIFNAFQSQSDFDTWIDNFYSFIVSNAAITGTSVDNWRSMTINSYYSTYPNAIGNWSPTGTYQQPSGYVQGSNNGTPASQYEKVWVLVNQYDHNWILP